MTEYELDQSIIDALLERFPNPKKANRPRSTISANAVAAAMRLGSVPRPRRRTPTGEHVVLRVPRRAWPRVHDRLRAAGVAFETHQAEGDDDRPGVTLTCPAHLAHQLAAELEDVEIEP